MTQRPGERRVNWSYYSIIRQSGGQQGSLSGSNQGNLDPGVSAPVTSNNVETRGIIQ